MPDADFFSKITASIWDMIIVFNPEFSRIGNAIFAAIVLYRLVDFFVKVGFGKIGPGWEQDLLYLLLHIAIVGTIQVFYETPIPGVGYSFTNIVTGTASSLAQTLDRGVMTNLYTHWQDMHDSFVEPGLLDFVEGGLYLLFTVVLLLAKALTLALIGLSLIFSALAALFGPLFTPLALLPAAVGYFKSWLSSFLQWSFLQVSCYGYLFIFEHYMRTYLTTLPTDIPSKYLQTLGMQGTTIGLIFIIGLLFIGYFNHGLFAGGNSATIFDRGSLRRYV